MLLIYLLVCNSVVNICDSALLGLTSDSPSLLQLNESELTASNASVVHQEQLAKLEHSLQCNEQEGNQLRQQVSVFSFAVSTFSSVVLCIGEAISIACSI